MGPTRNPGHLLLDGSEGVVHTYRALQGDRQKIVDIYFWIIPRLLLIIPCGGLLMSGVSYGLERLQSSDGGFCIALVPADIWTSLHPRSLFINPVL